MLSVGQTARRLNSWRRLLLLQLAASNVAVLFVTGCASYHVEFGSRTQSQEGSIQWIAGAAEAAYSDGCTGSTVEQRPGESTAEVISRFSVTGEEGACIILLPTSRTSNARYSLAWGGTINGKDLLYISEAGQPRIWNARDIGPLPARATPAVGPTASSQVTLNPGDDIQAAVDTNPERTEFLLRPGIYRLQSVQPKDGDIFRATGAILNGSKVLSFHLDSTGTGLWAATASYDSWPYGNACQPAFPQCYAPQDLFIDDRLQIRVSSVQRLVPGTWYFDQGSSTVFIPDNPAGHQVEIGMAQVAFGGPAVGVLIQGITIEKYATRAQFGAIQGTREWIVDEVECRWNHGAGIALGPESRIENSFIHHNGQIGIKLVGADSPDQLGMGMAAIHNEISWNNYAGFDYQWEAGGSKFLFSTGLILKDNYVHDNYGPGLWSDTDNFGAIYSGNLLLNNQREGIKDEANYRPTIRDNFALGNGNNEAIWSWNNPTQWLWNSQILLLDTSEASVLNNVLEVPDHGGNGFGIMNQTRESGPFGSHRASNNSVRGNTITFLSSSGHSGFADDTGSSSAAGNSFDTNHYTLSADGAQSQHWFWFEWLDWKSFRSRGQEAHGTCQHCV